MTNPYVPTAESKPTHTDKKLTHRTGGKLDHVAYTFIAVGHILTLILVILLLLISPFLLFGLIMGGVGSLEFLLIMVQVFFTVIYVGVLWASLRTLKNVAKKQCEES